MWIPTAWYTPHVPSPRRNAGESGSLLPAGGAAGAGTPLHQARARYLELYAEGEALGHKAGFLGHYIGQRLTGAQLIELAKEHRYAWEAKCHGWKQTPSSPS